MSSLERDEVEVKESSRFQRQWNHMSDLDSAGIPPQSEAPPVEAQRPDSMTDSEEFQDCEEELQEFPDSSSCSEMESASSIYHSFANTDVSQFGDDIDWQRRAAFEARSIEVDQSEASNSTEGNSSGCVLDMTPDPVSEMLVTLTSTHMGISAKRSTSPVPVRGAKVLETSIFDKVNLPSEALDTEEINRSLARNDDAPVYALPSLTVQEQHVEERNAEMRTPRSHRTFHIQPQLPSYGMEPAPRGAVHRFSNGIARARSAPTEIKPIIIPQEVMDADAEISEIIGRHPGTPFSPIEERPDTSLSEPFRSIVATEHNRTKQRSTTWIKRRLCFVSYDTESDAASITRSDVTGEIGRRDCNAGMNRARTSSSLRYAAGAVKGPRVSPVPRGGIRDFSKTEVFELNRKLSFEPQLAEIDMQEWTSKYIGFQSAADYYAHMVCDLSLHNINILALLKSRLGDSHPLIGEIIEKLINGTSDLPSFVLGKEIIHRPETRKNPREIGSKQPRDSWYSKVETTLIKCGLHTTFFDRSLTGMKSEHEYFEYIAQRIINENFSISSEVLSLLMDQLGDDHPFITVLLQTIRLAESDFENKKLSIIDSDENISSPVKFTPDQEDSMTEMNISNQVEEASKQDEDNMDSLPSAPGCSCFVGGCLRRFMNWKFSKCLLSHRSSTSNKKSV